ncbi:MAG: hypothetical protein JJ863_08320 [Deltaproteobacteria bacterium]|nr:hypothetical protein [Deltaproteobacteria bacterium]
MSEPIPKRLVDDPETDPDMKRDLRNSSEVRLPADLQEVLERIEREAWNEEEEDAPKHSA